MRILLCLALLGLPGCETYSAYKTALVGDHPPTILAYSPAPAANRVECNINTELASLEEALRYK